MILASYAYGLAVRSSCFGSVRKAFLLSANFPQEGLENRVNLPEDDPEVVSLVLVYLYTGVYCLEAAMPSCFPETVKHKDHDQAATPTIQTKEPELDGALSKSPEEAEVLSTSPSSDCMVHVAVYSCADRLGILSLKALACEKFMTSAKDIDEKSFARLLRAVYENTAAQDQWFLDTGLCRLLLKACPSVDLSMGWISPSPNAAIARRESSGSIILVDCR
jgi:hypothetical protein